MKNRSEKFYEASIKCLKRRIEIYERIMEEEGMNLDWIEKEEVQTDAKFVKCVADLVIAETEDNKEE